MALTFTKREQTVLGNKRVHIYDVTFDNSYPAGGEVVTPGNFGLNSFDMVVPFNSNNKLVKYDRVNKKLQLFTAVTALGTSTEATGDQSANTITVLAIGI